MKNEIRDRLVVVLLVVAAAIAGFNWQAYETPPTSQALSIVSPYAACVDQAGDYYVIDNGLSRVLKIGGDGELIYQIEGQSDKAEQFFRATALSAQGEWLYLADTTPAGKARLLALNSATGAVVGTVYQAEEGRISAVRVDENAYFALTLEDSTQLYRVDGLDCALVEAYSHGGLPATEFAISAGDETLYFATMTGDVYRADAQGPEKVYEGYVSLDDLESGTLARWISVDEKGALLLADTAARTVRKVAEGGAAIDLMPSGEPLLDRRIYSALYGVDGGFVALSSKLDEDTQLIHMDEDGALVASFTQARYGQGFRARQWALWGLAALVALAVLIKAAMLLLSLRKREKRRKPGEGTALALGLGSFAVVVLVAIALVLLPSIRQSTNQMVMDNLSSLSYLAAQLPVGDAITQIRDIDDYQGPAYRQVERQLNQLLTSVAQSELEYYYVLYTTDQVYGVTLIDSTGDYKMFQLQPRPFQGSDTQVYNFGQGIQMNYETFSDETGDWAFSVSPIRDSAGQVVAIIEVGVNSYTVRARNDATITGLLMTILTLVVILFMSYNELVAFGQFAAARRGGAALAETAQARVLRPLSFLIFLACSLQSAFVAILASRLYTPLWGLPQSVAVAIPVSASLLTTSIFGVVGGYLIGRLGVKRTLVLGCAIIAGAFAAIWLSLSFGMLILGRLISGVGMGMAAVGINALASAGEAEQVRSEAFTGYNTGMTAGVNIGTVLGSQLVGVIGYQGVYLAAAAALVGIIGFVLKFVPSQVAVRQKKVEGGPMGAGAFLRSRRVWSFFLCVFLPYTVCSYFLYYFFPLYADMNGMTEASIGRFYLLAGLIVVGCGPALTRFMIRTFGSFFTNAAANVLYAAVFLWFALSPSMELAVVAVVLLSLFDSFGFSAQSIYYSGLDAVERLGTGKAMGIFSMMENVAQTAAPFLFGFGLTLGTGLGIAVIGLSSVALLPVYLLAGRKRKERRRDAVNAGA